MKNTILIFPLLAFEWENGKGRTITVGWLKYTYSINWQCTTTTDKRNQNK